jgi:hypothetical protein
MKGGWRAGDGRIVQMIPPDSFTAGRGRSTGSYVRKRIADGKSEGMMIDDDSDLNDDAQIHREYVVSDFITSLSVDREAKAIPPHARNPEAFMRIQPSATISFLLPSDRWRLRSSA